MQFVHAIEVSDSIYDRPTKPYVSSEECDMWINAELIRTIETTDMGCFIVTEDACYLVDKVADNIHDVLQTEM